MHIYGDKPAWFTRLVDGGNLPAIELDGSIVTESMDIMRLMDETFPDRGVQLFPVKATNTTKRSEETEHLESLFRMEQKLQSDWFSLVFYPVEGDALTKARDDLISTLGQVDDALSSTSGPWFLGDSAPSIVDILFVATMERVVASCMYWKGLQIRDTGQFPNVDIWLKAFTERPSYGATKADIYSMINAIPSQNGPGYLVDEAKGTASRICGLNGAWGFPLDYNQEFVEADVKDEEAHRHEAAFALADRHDAIIAFGARGAGEVGRPSFHAELADPYAEPNEEFMTPVDVCLRHVTVALLNGSADPSSGSIAAEDLAGEAGDGSLRDYWGEYIDNGGQIYWWNEITGEAQYTPPTKQLDTCLAYLRDRVGVPRDMSPGAAAQLRAHLNWAIDLLNGNAPL